MLRSPILRQLDLPNLFTLTGLALTLLSITWSIQGRFALAILGMMYAGLFDLFDGVVARKILERTPLQTAVGKQLDSLVDLCSFGLGPVVFAYCYGLQSFWEILLLLFYLVACASRLAYFNCTGMASEGKTAFFTGMPVTYAALWIPLAFTIHLGCPASLVRPWLAIWYGGIAAAMVAGWKIPKPRGSWYGVFGFLALLLTAYYAWAIWHG
ncbi:MAG: CDP-alcohol phosphatidyltransferase family protein [Cyanobacteria bacterium NC_groundwater_1444_Ag_S-0.65um_54_12]|nr:CDP-alcohol phosphatidyltransferase family protein [Cyanobacteria bacterium NC_groundwater_1444_Ag_S-0.65um_54_12]